MKKGLMLVMFVMGFVCANAQWRGGQGRHCQPHYSRPFYNAPRVGFGIGIGFGIRPGIRVVVNPMPQVVCTQPQVVYTQPPPQPQPRIERIWVEGHYEESQQGRVWVEGHYIQREVY